MSQTEQLKTTHCWIPTTIRLISGRKKIFLLTIHSLIAILLSAIPASAANSVKFPGKTSEIKSPNGLYTIKSVELPVKNGEPEYLLLLLRRGQKCNIELTTYHRNVDVLWSPDSASFVVNYWFGSNLADASLFRVQNLKHPIEISASLKKALSKNDDDLNIPEIACCYLFANRWINAKTLEIKKTGHGQSQHGTNLESTVYIEWDLQRNSCKVTKRVAKEDTSRPWSF